MLLWWWLEGGTDKDGILQASSTPSIPAKASLLGTPSIGQFRREFRSFFSRHVLLSTHRTTDAFAQVEKGSLEEAKLKGPKKAKAKAAPGLKKSPTPNDSVIQLLRSALKNEGFQAKQIDSAVSNLRSRIDAGEGPGSLILAAIHVLTRQAGNKK